MNEPTLFDMSEIQPTGQVVQATERIKLRLKRTAEDIIEIGKDLILIKAELGHGQFMPWVEHHFEMNIRTARRFIEVAERFSGKSDIMSDFNPTILYELSAHSTPESVVQEVTAKVEAGETVSVKEVKELKKQIKEEQEAKDKIHHELSVNKQMVNYLKKDIEEFNQERDQLAKEIERLQAAAAQPVVKEVEIIKEVEVVKEVTVIPDGYSSVEKAIAEKQARLKELEKEEQVKLENRRILMIDIHDLQERMNAGVDKKNITKRAIRQMVGRLRFALGEVKAHSVKVNPLYLDDDDFDEFNKAIMGLLDIQKELVIAKKSAPIDAGLEHGFMKAVQIVSI